MGAELPARVPVTRADLVRYAGASGDFNPIHWNQRFATEVGLPNVIAHGMFTMASAIRVVTDWAGDPGAVRVRRAVHPSGGGARSRRRDPRVAGRVRAVREDGVVEVDLITTVAGQTVLAKARALVRVDAV